MSKYEFRLDQYRILLLSGKNTKRLGVETLKGPEGESLPVTNTERTLIDTVVRPAYAGGITQVLEAFKTARGLVSVERLLTTLEGMGFVYPYHQAIGFLMERAGYDEEDCARLRTPGTQFDFYLVHGMKKKQYDEAWRLFYPEGF
jgi:predicted transcriptional regulator of viral defense system